MKKLLASAAALALAASALSGCGGSGTAGNNSGKEITKTTSENYPIETDVKLRYWVSLSGHVSAKSTSLNDTPFAKALIEQTGIDVEFIHPPAGAENEKFGLMISSDDVPDIIEYGWSGYSGGPDKAIDDGVILSLNDIIETVSPNIKKYLEENENVAKQLKTNNDQYYVYPFIVQEDVLATYMGGMVRKDLLDKAGLEAPETISEWDTMLRKFKDMGVEVPLTMKIDNKFLGSHSAFLGAFGAAGGFYVDDNKVKYGPYEPVFKDYVELLTGWFKDGLFDKNFMDTDSKRITAIMGNGNGGSAFGSAGGDFGKWIPALKTVDPNASFVPVKYPVMNKGDKPFVGQRTNVVSGYGAAISADSENPEICARLLDYGYSDEGHMLYNFGIEGESYTMENGEAVYTDIILDNEKNGGLGIGPAMGQYQRACYNGPFVQDKGYIYQFYSLDAQKQALDVWSDTDADKHIMPLVYMTDEENKEYTRIMNDVDSFREEYLYKVIAGKTPLSDFDNYYAQMKARGIEDAIKIQQSAYDRYLAK